MALAGGYLCRNAASYDHNTHAAFPGSLCVGRQVTVKSKICCKIAFRARLLLFSSLGGFLGAPPGFAWSSTRRTPPCRSPVCRYSRPRVARPTMPQSAGGLACHVAQWPHDDSREMAHKTRRLERQQTGVCKSSLSSPETPSSCRMGVESPVESSVEWA